MSARIVGSGDRIVPYELDDTDLAVGSTLGAPKGALLIKASGAIDKFYSSDLGSTLLAGVSLEFWEEPSGAVRPKLGGRFRIYPDRQEYTYGIGEGITIRETVLVLSRQPRGAQVDALTGYLLVEMRNESQQTVEFDSLCGALLRGDTPRDVRVRYDDELHAVVAWNASLTNHGRAFGCSKRPTSFEVTGDHGKITRAHFPGRLSDAIARDISDPIALFHHRYRLAPGAHRRLWFTLTGSSTGARGARRVLRDAPPAPRAIAATRHYYEDVLSRSVVLTPDPNVNFGVLWAKANMLRVELYAPTGWGFVNDPTRSNNSVGRDTASFVFGSDYVTPEFSRESLGWYLQNAQSSGKIVEYYDIRNGRSEDYGLNVNDDTPWVILGLVHHFLVTGDEDFMRASYPAAKRAAEYLLAQRDERGLVWCTSTETYMQGIVGWRNIIDDYRISGASTEINALCFAALTALSRLALAVDEKKDAARFAGEADALREAINTHLVDPQTGLYYLTIDVDGQPRSNVTADLIYPILLGVADREMTARIVSRLSVPNFWTEAGIRTVARDDLEYNPTRSWGLLGGVWVGMSFAYALAAARVNPGFMAYALGMSFQHYARDPKRYNTVPGQFSEWLHGETLTNCGMMLSPWYPARYVWAAVEGAGGLNIREERLACNPHLAPQWKWIGVRNLPYRGKRLSWFAGRLPKLTLYANHPFDSDLELRLYARDVTPLLHLSEEVTEIALRRGPRVVIFIGNAAARAVTTPIRLRRPLRGRYHVRYFTSLLGEWVERRNIEGRDLERGFAIEVDAHGFCIIELQKIAGRPSARS